MRVAKPIQRGEDLAEYGLELAAAAIVGVDRGDDGALVFLDEARERLEVGEPLGAARLRRLEEGGALRGEAGLKLGGDGKVGDRNSGRVHGSLTFLMSAPRIGFIGSKRAPP